jgi:hypothetical protein
MGGKRSAVWHVLLGSKVFWTSDGFSVGKGVHSFAYSSFLHRSLSMLVETEESFVETAGTLEDKDIEQASVVRRKKTRRIKPKANTAVELETNQMLMAKDADKFGERAWIADSGASTHMFNSSKGMFDLEDLPPNDRYLMGFCARNGLWDECHVSMHDYRPSKGDLFSAFL